MNKLYVLDHDREAYHDENEPNRKFIESKLLGVFDSHEKASTNIEKYKRLIGFKDYPEGFKISDYTVDTIFNDHINQILDLPPSCDLKRIYTLYFVFEYPDGYDDSYLLGLFSSQENAEKAKKFLLKDPRLKKFSDLEISDGPINTPYWTEGFITWEQSLKKAREKDEENSG